MQPQPASLAGGAGARPDHPILMSPVKHRARDFLASTRTHREVVALMDRAEERAGPEDVGEQALMRGLDTAFPFFRLGLSWSSVGHRSEDRPHNGFQEFPCRGPALTSARLMSLYGYAPIDLGCNGGAVGRSSAPHARAVHSPGRRYAVSLAMSSRLIAQMKADSSRAIAVAMTVRRLPFRSSDRNRPHSLVCAFHAISRTRLGAAATFGCLSRLTRGGYR